MACLLCTAAGWSRRPWSLGSFPEGEGEDAFLAAPSAVTQRELLGLARGHRSNTAF